MSSSQSWLVATLTILCAIASQGVHAFPSNRVPKIGDLATLKNRETKQPEWLRIMPLGASIVHGLKSTPEDGFRKALRDDLRSQRFSVNMVGSQFNDNGSMQDGNHEGHPGHRIDQIIVNLDLAAGKTKPNIYLINAGTNDCQQNYKDMKGTIDRMEDLTAKAWKLSPKSTIILSTVLPSNNTSNPPGASDRVNKLNPQIRDLATKLKKAGKRVVLAEMNNGAISLSDLGPDKIHPTNAGYTKMANIWNKAIAEALKSEMIQSPDDNGTPDQSLDGTCTNDKTSSQSAAITPAYIALKNRDAIKSYGFAQVINARGSKDPKDALDDMISWTRADNKITAEYRANKGDGHFDDPITIDLPFDCPSTDIHWADMNGDHLDDFICVSTDGDLAVAVNAGITNGNLSFKEAKISTPKHEGYTGTNVRLADVDGDGRTDYCVIGNDGVTKCWKNTVSGDEAKWEDMGTLFKAEGKGDISAVRYIDMNGDGRADWVTVNNNGRTDIWTNRQCDGSKVPCWSHAEPLNGGEGGSRPREQVHFARVFAKGDEGRGLRDYVYLESGDDGKFWIRVWKGEAKGSAAKRAVCEKGSN